MGFFSKKSKEEVEGVGTLTSEEEREAVTEDTTIEEAIDEAVTEDVTIEEAIDEAVTEDVIIEEAIDEAVTEDVIIEEAVTEDVIIEATAGEELDEEALANIAIEKKRKKKKIITVVGIILGICLIAGAIIGYNILKPGWKDSDDGLRYKETGIFGDYEFVTGVHEIDGELYYFGKGGYLEYGWIETDEFGYYADEKGRLLRGIHEIEGVTYNFDEEEGFLLLGWVKTDEGNYYYDKEKGKLTGYQTIDGKQYKFDEKGLQYIGFDEKDGDRLLFLEDGKNNALVEFEDEKYFVNEDYTLASGVKTIDGSKYYFSTNSNEMVSGWQSQGGDDYYFDPTSFTAVTGNKTINGKSYYFLSSGVLAEGWVTINGEQYYYLNNKKVTEPTSIGGATYYFNSDGTITTGWVDSSKSYKNKYGVKVTGWQTIGGNKYHFNSSGIKSTNTTIGLYNLNSKGVATKAAATSANLGLHLDDILNTYGRSLSGAASASSSMVSYRSMGSSGGTSANAIYAINNRRGACYQIASLNYMLVTRMGYSAEYIVGTGRTGNTHAWIAVHTGGKTLYYDAIYSSGSYTEEELKKLNMKW